MIRLSIFLFIFLAVGCKESSSYDKLSEFVQSEHGQDLRSFSHIVIINEMGGCINCNNSFSKLMAKHIENESILYVISTPGSKIDVSAYLNIESNNTIYDFRNKFGDLGIVERCGIIALKENAIDSVMEINQQSLHESVSVLENWLGD